MPPRYIKTITVARPDEIWQTRVTANHGGSGSSSPPNFEFEEQLREQTASSSQRPTPTSRRRRRVDPTVAEDSDDAVGAPILPRTSTKARESPVSSTSIARSKRPSTINGSPLSNTRITPTRSPALNPAKVYGIVPNKLSRRADVYAITGFQTQIQTAGAAVTSSTPQSAILSAGASQHLHDPLPNLPSWFACFILGWLVLGFVAGALFYLASFPPGSKWMRVNRRQKQGHQKVKVEDIELDEYGSPSAFSTSADTPTFSLHQRHSPKGLTVDTTATYSGLGIAMRSEDAPELHQRKSFDDRLGLQSPLPASPATTAPLPSSYSSTFSPRINVGNTSYESPHHREPHLEDGLLRPTYHRHESSPSPPLSPHSSRSSSRARLFEKIGDGVEYATDYLSKMMHDQVRDDPEDGLLLPVRSSGRETVAFESGKLKKGC